ncbi:MAG: FeoB-associated Cys-rich membrane protein [Oscillospiraceae bacterium]|jgi:hypothetical protein|nr:FeoB-associated Cys-rich membrane protein [Oscillospiraceae bacterium]
MTDFLQNYGGTLLIGAVVAAAIALVIVRLIRQKKRTGSATCDCGSCGETNCPMRLED